LKREETNMSKVMRRIRFMHAQNIIFYVLLCTFMYQSQKDWSSDHIGISPLGLNFTNVG